MMYCRARRSHTWTVIDGCKEAIRIIARKRCVHADLGVVFHCHGGRSTYGSPLSRAGPSLGHAVALQCVPRNKVSSTCINAVEGKPMPDTRQNLRVLSWNGPNWQPECMHEGSPELATVLHDESRLLQARWLCEALRNPLIPNRIHLYQQQWLTITIMDTMCISRALTLVHL